MNFFQFAASKFSCRILLVFFIFSEKNLFQQNVKAFLCCKHILIILTILSLVIVRFVLIKKIYFQSFRYPDYWLHFSFHHISHHIEFPWLNLQYSTIPNSPRFGYFSRFTKSEKNDCSTIYILSESESIRIDHRD